MTARTEILRRVREALHDNAPRTECSWSDDNLGQVALSSTEREALFIARVEEYGAEVSRVGVDQLARAVAAGLRDVSSVVIPVDLEAGWLAEAGDMAVAVDSPFSLSTQALDATGAALTGCAMAIAETGTIVLDGGVGQGRRILTLLPDLHVCVVPASLIVTTVPEALRRLDSRRPLTFISGPSATSDIELSRVEGVHGPRVLRVIVLQTDG